MEGSLCYVLDGTYAWGEVCVRFWVGAMHGGKFVLDFEWTYAWREVCVKF